MDMEKWGYDNIGPSRLYPLSSTNYPLAGMKANTCPGLRLPSSSNFFAHSALAQPHYLALVLELAGTDLYKIMFPRPNVARHFADRDMFARVVVR